ncbi:hypothetical protein IMY05_014G0005800 [Salix suchowensis]|nr:hypothetical protein IMY05_014G0005800 [Salix suchowensis]
MFGFDASGGFPRTGSVSIHLFNIDESSENTRFFNWGGVPDRPVSCRRYRDLSVLQLSMSVGGH